MDSLRFKGSRKPGVSSDRFVSPEGNKLQKMSNTPRLSSDSSSRYSETWGQDALTYELGWKSSRNNLGTPIKRLLAQEMSKEDKSRGRSPSIVARLMGLDGLPPQNPSQKQPMITLSEKDKRNSMFPGRRSSRKCSKEEEEFKDVFEVLDMPKVDSSRYSSHGSRNADFDESELAFIQQKFMEAKRLSTDEKLQRSEEFHDALEALDSNKDLLLRFLQHPDSLFSKHLQDLMKSSSDLKHDGSTRSPKSDRETLGRSRSRSPLTHRASSCPTAPRSRQGPHSNPIKLPGIELEEKMAPQAARIVVLKPKVGQIRSANTNGLSPGYPSDDFRTDCRLPCTRNRGSEFWYKKNMHEEDEGLTRHNFRGSRVNAKEVTRRMRACSTKSGFMNSPASGFQGYAGDESSSGSESASGSEFETLTKSGFMNSPALSRKNLSPSSSRSTESSVSREAKKRLSERWNLTQKLKRMGDTSGSSTLAQMLAVSDKEARPGNFNSFSSEAEFSNNFRDDVRRTELAEPLGISSRDGWKNERERNMLKPSSFLASSSASESPHFEKITMKRSDKNELVEGNYDNNEAFFSWDPRYSSKKSQPSFGTSPYVDSRTRRCKNSSKNDRSSDQNFLIPEKHASSSIGIISDTMNAAKNVSFSRSCLDFSASTSANDPTGDHHISRPQEQSSKSSAVPSHAYVPELPSPVSTKEGDQPSPVSVLEATFLDDISSRSGFESVSADLNGLRMQLQLLKLETGEYKEGAMLVSSDEDDADQERFLDSANEKTDIQESSQDWKSLYLVDVLMNSRFNDSDLDAFIATRNSSDSPVSPSLFGELEKKYSNSTSSSRSQRKFLFDSINAELLEISKKSADPHPWVKKNPRWVVVPEWDITKLQDTLRKLITRKEDAGEKVMETDSQWLNLEDDIEIIGWEIEKLLTDELIAEIIEAI